MNEVNTTRLYSNFPVLYRDKDRSKLESAMCWGFQCGDGWFQLIYDLSVAIEAKALELGLDPGSVDFPKVLEVKEKFGALRFYIDTPSVESKELIDQLLPETNGGILSFRPVASIASIRELVREAEKQSLSICEVCGQPGTLRREGWWQVRCEACVSEILEK